jgi:hypothetical protein
MNTRIVPALRGARWLAEGWQMFRVAPLGWLALVFAYWLLMTLVSVVPYVGLVAASVLVPPLSVGFMAAARAAASGAQPRIGHLFEGLRDRVSAQLVLGVIYTALLALIIAVTMLADEGALASWLTTGRHPSEEALGSVGFMYALMTAAGLYVPVTMLYWFAPLLVAWHGFGPVKALFFSFFACLMNWRAFLAYGAVTALVAIVFPFIALSLLMAMVPGEQRVAATSLVFPLLVIMLPTLFASFYASYRDVFAGEPGAAQGP